MESRLVAAAPVVLAIVVALTFAPQAQARETAKFKVLSITGSNASTRDVVVNTPPDYEYGTCAYTWTERIRFRSTERVTAYTFTSKAHGRARVAWSPLPTFTHNLTQVAVPGEVTVSRSATYRQNNYVDEDAGGTVPGCYNHVRSPVDCAVERTFPATLNISGTSGTDESTYVELDYDEGDLYEACLVANMTPSDAPVVFSRTDLFNRKKKRLSDTDRVEESYDRSNEHESDIGTSVEELTAELKRKKPRR
jgi:hypothetical protein